MGKKSVFMIVMSIFASIVLTITMYLFYDMIKKWIGNGEWIVALFIALTLLLLFAGFLGWDKLMKTLGLK